jgi:hypothetical protein
MSADPAAVAAMRRKALSKGVANMETEDLLFLAKNNKPPIYPSDVVNWADREAFPLMQELGNRLAEATKPVAT